MCEEAELLAARMIVVGNRRVLHHLATYVRDEWRWVTLSWQGRPDWSFHQLLVDEQPRIERELAGRTRRAAKAVRPDMITANVPGVGISREFHRSGQGPSQSVTARLRELATQAAKHRRTLLLIIDELQAVSPSDLAALSGTLQILANGEHLPVAMVAAGLSNTKSVIRAVPGTTFIERQEELRLGNLDPDATMDALQRPIAASARSISRAALDLLVETTEGYPYAVQLAGKYTWDAVGEASNITLHHARRGAERTIEALTVNIYQSPLGRLARPRTPLFTGRRQTRVARR